MAEYLWFIEVSDPNCANIHPWQGHYKVWNLGAHHPSHVQHSDNQKEQINLPLHSHHGSLVIYNNDRHGGKTGKRIILFSRHLGMCWRGYWAPQERPCNPQPRGSCYALLEASILSCFKMELCYPPSVVCKQHQNCRFLLPLILPAFMIKYLSSAGLS